MKKRRLTRFVAAFVLTLMSLGAFAQVQVPDSFNYQAIVRDVNGNVLAGEEVTVRMTFLDGVTMISTADYIVETNNYGLINLAADLMPATFAGTYYAEPKIKIEIDFGSGFVELGINDLQSVPYAMQAGNVATLNGEVLTVGNGSSVTIPDAALVGQNSTNIATLQGDVVTIQSSITLLGNAVADHTTRIEALEGAGFITNAEEIDPVFQAAPAYGITASDVQHWGMAYGWGDHGQEGYATELWVLDKNYLVTESDPIFKASPSYGITPTQISDWDEAHGWGDHNSMGYLVGPEVDPIFMGSVAYTITLADRQKWDEAWDWGDHHDAIDDLQDELDNTQVGAGLQPDGSYLPPAAAKAANYISGATSLFNADELLDAQIKINENDIATNSGLIAGNTAQIATNATLIASNASDIDSNFNLIDENSHWIFDDDQDTYVTVEETSDEDIIHMYANGDEMLRIKKKGQLEVLGESLFIGDEAGDNAITNTDNNIFIGPKAGKNTTTGANNVFIGYTAGISNVSGSNNLYLGNATGYFSTVGSSNTMLGSGSGKFVSTGAGNTYVGASSGMNTSTGAQNAYFGVSAGYSNDIGSLNVAMGANANYSNEDGSQNTVIGAFANYYNVDGNSNTMLGNYTGYLNSNGSGNVFIGNRAGYHETQSDKFYVSNRSGSGETNGREMALLYGDFSAEYLRINAQTTVTEEQQAYESYDHTIGSGALVVDGGTYIYKDLFVNLHTQLDQTTIDVNDGEFLIHDGENYSPISNNGMMADVYGYIGLVSQLDGNAASGIQTIDESNRPTAALSLNAVNGGIDIQAASDVAIDAQNIYGDATQSISLDAAETSNFTVTNGDAAQNLLINVAGAGQAHQLNLVSTGTENWQNSDTYGAAIRMLASDGGIDIDAFEGVDIFAQTTSQYRVVNDSDPQNLNIGVEGGNTNNHVLNLFSDGNATSTLSDTQTGAIQMTAQYGGIDVMAAKDIHVDGSTIYLNGDDVAKGSNMAIGIGTDNTNGNIHIGHDQGNRIINIGLGGIDEMTYTDEVNIAAEVVNTYSENNTNITAGVDVDVDATNQIFLSASGFQNATEGPVSTGAVQIDAVNGGIDISAASDIALDGTDIFANATSQISLDAVEESNFTVSNGDLLLQTGTSDIYVDASDQVFITGDNSDNAAVGTGTPSGAIQMTAINGGIDVNAAQHVAIDGTTVYINGTDVAKGTHPAVAIGTNNSSGNILVGNDEGARNVMIGTYTASGTYTQLIEMGAKTINAHSASSTTMLSDANFVVTASDVIDMDAGDDIDMRAEDQVFMHANGDQGIDIAAGISGAMQITSNEGLEIEADENIDIYATTVYINGIDNPTKGSSLAVGIGTDDTDGNIEIGNDEGARDITIGQYESAGTHTNAITIGGNTLSSHTFGITDIETEANMILDAAVDVDMDAGHDVLITAASDVDIAAVNINGDATGAINFDADAASHFVTSVDDLRIDAASDVVIGNLDADAIHIAQDGVTTFVHGHLDVDGNTTLDATHITLGTAEAFIVDSEALPSVDGGISMIVDAGVAIQSLATNVLVDGSTGVEINSNGAILIGNDNDVQNIEIGNSNSARNIQIGNAASATVNVNALAITSTAGNANTINGGNVDVNATSGNVTIDGTAVFINGTAAKGNNTGIGIGNENNDGNILIGTAGARNITIGNANAGAIGIDGFTLDIHTDSDATIASDGTMSLTAVNDLTMGSTSGGFNLSGAQSSTITSGVNLLVDAQTNLNLGTSTADLVQIAQAGVQTTVLGNLHVVQPLTTASSLTVDGATNLNSLLDVDGLVTFNNTTTASATGTTKGALEVVGGVYIGDNLEVVNNIHAAGTITSGNSITIDGTGAHGVISETHSDIRFAWADLSEIANIEVETLSATTITASDGMFSGNLNVDGQTTLDATTINLDTDEQFIVSGTTDSGVDFDVHGGISFDANAASNFTTTAGNLTLSSAAITDINGVTVDVDATTGGVHLDGAGASNFNTSSGSLTLGAATDVIATATALMDINGAGVDIDATGGNNVTIDGLAVYINGSAVKGDNTAIGIGTNGANGNILIGNDAGAREIKIGAEGATTEVDLAANMISVVSDSEVVLVGGAKLFGTASDVELKAKEDMLVHSLGTMTMSSAEALAFNSAKGFTMYGAETSSIKSGMQLTIDAATTLNLGTSSATTLNIGRNGIATNVLGSLHLAEALTLSDALTMDGVLTVTNETAADYSTQTGALIVDGGVYVEKNIETNSSIHARGTITSGNSITIDGTGAVGVISETNGLLEFANAKLSDINLLSATTMSSATVNASGNITTGGYFNGIVGATGVRAEIYGSVITGDSFTDGTATLSGGDLTGLSMLSVATVSSTTINASDAILTGDLDVDGIVNINNTTVATAVGLGALVVDGGIYVAKNIETASSIHAAGTITSGNSITIDGTGAVGVITESHGELEFAGANLSNIGTITGITGITATGNIQGGTLTDGTATLTGGVLTANGSTITGNSTINGDFFVNATATESGVIQMQSGVHRWRFRIDPSTGHLNLEYSNNGAPWTSSSTVATFIHP